MTEEMRGRSRERALFEFVVIPNDGRATRGTAQRQLPAALVGFRDVSGINVIYLVRVV
jgi:hypothetical protein